MSGWLLIYIVGSIPLLAFYAAGLSGWFYDYPLPLFVTLFVVLIIPVVMLPLRVPVAPLLNIMLVWSGALLITLRILWGLSASAGGPTVREWPILIAIPVVAVAWAVAWTWYFLVSARVARLFG